MASVGVFCVGTLVCVCVCAVVVCSGGGMEVTWDDPYDAKGAIQMTQSVMWPTLNILQWPRK